MITVTGYDGGINFINDNLQDITLTSLERIGVKRYQNDHVTSINKINGETYFGTLSGYLFTLDNELKIDNLIYLDDKIRDVLSKQDKNIVITSKNYLEINNNLEIIFSEKLPANGLTCGVYNDDNSLLISFFDKSLYSMSDRKFTKIKNFSKPLYNISSDNEHYYFAFGPTKNGRLMICDKKMDKKKKINYPGYVLSSETSDGSILISSEGFLEKVRDGKFISSRKISKKNITQIINSQNNEHYALASSRNLLYSIDKNLDVSLVRMFNNLITCVR